MFRVKMVEIVIMIFFIYFLVNYQLYLSQVKYMSQNQDIALHINSEQSKDFGERNTSIIKPKQELASFSRQNTSDFVHTEDILNFTPMNIFQLPKLQYLQNLKNPCVFVKTKETKRKWVAIFFLYLVFTKWKTFVHFILWAYWHLKS